MWWLTAIRIARVSRQGQRREYKRANNGSSHLHEAVLRANAPRSFTTTCAVPPAPCAPLRRHLTASQSFLPSTSAVLPLQTTIHKHASPTVARRSSSSNSSQCRSYRLVDPPEARNRKPVAPRRRHTAVVARRDAPVDPPHRQVIAGQAETSHQRSHSKGKGEPAEHRTRQACIAEQPRCARG